MQVEWDPAREELRPAVSPADRFDLDRQVKRSPDGRRPYGPRGSATGTSAPCMLRRGRWHIVVGGEAMRRMVLMLSCLIWGFCSAAASMADVETIEATISTVDAKGRALTLATKEAGRPKLELQ